MDVNDSREFTSGESIPVQQQTNSKVNVMEEIPLVLASKNGNLNEVKYLIERAKVDVNQQCNFTIRKKTYDVRPIHGSALHAAVIAGQLEVVYYLVNCCKLNIDAQTKELSPKDYGRGCTALYLAVIHIFGDVQEKIVTCLLKNGADWTISCGLGLQCWELAFDKKLVKLLIHFGVGLDSSRNAKSSNIAHMWAKKSSHGFAAKAIALAIEKGININEPDCSGATPLMLAAIGEEGIPNLEVVEMLLEQEVQPVSRFDEIIALELLGATYISNYEYERFFGIGFHQLKMAMKLRFNVESEPPIPKSPTSLSEEAKIIFHREVETMEELKGVKNDPHSLRIQAHLIRIRILGLKHSVTMRNLKSYAISLWNLYPRKFLNYSHFILKNLDFQYCSNLFPLLGFAITRVSNGVDNTDENISTFKNAMPFLDELVRLLDNASDPHNIGYILNVINHLVQIVLDDKPLTSQESFDLKRCLHHAARLQKRNADGYDLLLLACSDSGSMSVSIKSECADGTLQHQTVSHQRSVSAKIISILIEAGSDLNSTNNNGDTALHVLASNIVPNLFLPCARPLCEAGIHQDQINSKEKTVWDILRDRKMDPPDFLLQPPSLKCLCSRIVRPFSDLFSEIHPDLVKFVMQH